MTTETERKIGSIKTYTLIAWIFSILVVVAWVVLFLYYFVLLFVIAGLLGSSLGYYMGYVSASLAIAGLIWGIVLLVFMVPSVLVMRRAGRLYHAAKRNDVRGLKEADSVGLAVVALIFTGVVPGILLLVAHGPISELEIGAVSGSPSLGADAIDKLERLKKLMDTGVITQTEFDEQKKRILGPLNQSMNTPEEELIKLKQLLDSGAITKLEYEEQKKRVLSKI